MRRRRLAICGIILAISVVGIPLPAGAKARIPPTVERALEVDRSAAIRPTAIRGVWLERGSMSLPINANLVAASFVLERGKPSELETLLSVEARFHTASGWSEWEVLGIEPDEAPDPAEAKRANPRVFTAPIWVGTADQFMFRAIAQPGGPSVRDLRLHVINTLGNAENPGLLARASAAVSRFLRGSPAQAWTTSPTIITRAQWGADESWRECCPRYAPAVKMAFVHHTVGSNSYSRSDSAAIVRGIYRFHARDRGWSDIGYNFLVDKYGQVFEGRAGGITEPVIGAHVKGFNTGSTGVSLMGTFTSVTPTAAMVNALEKLLAWKLDVHHVPPIGTIAMTSLGSDDHPAGQVVTFNRISGHRDGQSTSCPGTRAYALLPSIRNVVNGIGLPKLYLPAPNTTVVRPDGDAVNESVRFTGTFTTTVDWTLTFTDAEGVGVIRSFSGHGSSISQWWDGKTAGGAFARSGPVRWTLEGSDSTNHHVRPGVATIYLATTYPNGTLFSAPGGTSFLEGGSVRKATNAVRDSWFRPGEAVTVTDALVARYSDGADLDPREGTVYVDPDSDHFMWSGGALRKFSNDTVYAALGYTAASALPLDSAAAADMHSGPNISDLAVHPSGAIVTAPDGGAWTISGGTRRFAPTLTVRKSWYRDAEVVTATAGDLALPAGPPVTYRPGTLLKRTDGTIWMFSDGTLRGLEPGLLAALGFNAAAALALPAGETSSMPTSMFGHYPPLGTPLAGDWNGNNTVTPGVVRGNWWYLNDGFDAGSEHIFGFGLVADKKIAGDWNDDGTDSVGVVRGNWWYLDDNNDGTAEQAFGFGSATDLPIAGDWNGDGKDTAGVVRGSWWYLDDNNDGTSEHVFGWGLATDKKVVGDWDGNGTVTPGLVRGNTWYLNNGFDTTAEVVVSFGSATDTPIVGDWNGNGADTIGVVRGYTWYLRNSNSTGNADISYVDEG